MPQVDWEVDILPDGSTQVVPGRTSPSADPPAQQQLPVDAEAILTGAHSLRFCSSHIPALPLDLPAASTLWVRADKGAT